ncbi:MAG TPA: Fe-S protein assembly co-chaperone HscB [Flavisolibacter sp.]|nr:Fe-S protein assembly co-chaperone HscB [Flavisolibacter sp.]
MTYFEQFGLPLQLKVDKQLLRKRYLELSRQHHPDYFVNKGAAEQEKALESSALLNKGLKTLGDADETIRYVLELKGLITEEEKYTLPPAFLMQVMEVNEELAEMEPGDDARREGIEQQLETLEKEIYEPVKEIIENYSEGHTSEQALLQVKHYYFQKKYLDRLRGQLSGKS